MYRLTPRMLQRFERDLQKYHELFSGGRCQGWEQEELIVAAVKSDTTVQHQVFWKEAGHDDKADIKVKTNKTSYLLQIKSGQIIERDAYLKLSGPRLGRFKGRMEDITKYLNSNNANIIAIPYKKVDDKKGRKHIYQLSYIDVRLLTGLIPDRWKKIKKSYKQVNPQSVEFFVRPSLSWQVWWKIPLSKVEREELFVIQ